MFSRKIMHSANIFLPSQQSWTKHIHIKTEDISFIKDVQQYILFMSYFLHVIVKTEEHLN